jgi:signal transduction histidine kinase
MSARQEPLSIKTIGRLGSAQMERSAGLPTFIRTVWVLYLVTILSYIIAGLPLVFQLNQQPCEGIGCLAWQLPADNLARLAQYGISLAQYGWYSTLVPLIVPLLALALVTLVLFKRPTDHMVWLFALAIGTCPVNLSMSTLALAGAYPLMRFPAQLIEFFFASLFAFVLLFPDGRFITRWISWLVLLNGLFIGMATFFPASTEPGTATAIAIGAWQAVSALLMVGTLIYRYIRVADRKQRSQIKLLGFGLLIPLMLTTAFGLLAKVAQVDLQPGSPGAILQQTFDILGIALFILCLWAAVYRYQMFDIDLILNRTLVYTVLTATVIGLHILLVTGLGALLRARESFLVSLIATGIIAVLFQPLREGLQRAVNRLLYGKRDDPYQVLAQLGSRLISTHGADEIIPTIVETIRETLNLPYVAIQLNQSREGAKQRDVSSQPTGQINPFPIMYQGVQLGTLLACARAGENAFSMPDQRLLRDFARQAGIAIHAVTLAQDLQRSREELVTAREEERRRLRRDMHDGLGPSLATISIQSETARSLLRNQPEAAEAMLDELTNQAQSTMQDVRRLIHALRPPVLDDLGLVSGLNALAASFSQSGVSISVRSANKLPEMPAAYEVAIYRIVQETLTNVVKHARANTCIIRLIFDQGFCLDIEDDGIGISKNRISGVGMSSMRERAEELGGTFTSNANVDHGTHIQVRLPIRSSHGPYSDSNRG